MTTTATLKFLGAAGGVTGSKHLLTVGNRRILMDCGLFQGLKSLRLRNWEPPPFRPDGLDAVILSHAHLDHTGYLPVLVRLGFHGPIHCTPGTRDLVRILLLDSAALQEEEAAHANRHGWSKHRPAAPLYTVQDAERVFPLLVPHGYRQEFPVVPGMRACLRPAGHILGSATVDMAIDEPPLRLAYSGDLGRPRQPILIDPEPVPEADVLLVESTYGDRIHPKDPTRELERIVVEAAARGGALLVPVFAVGRMQLLIWVLRELEEAGRIPRIPIYIDSPMANRVTEVYCRHLEDLDQDIKQAMSEKRCPLCCKRYRLVHTTDESKALNDVVGPLLILAGSGMMTGGRIVHHLEHRLASRKTTVLLAGFQAAGTRGRALREGARQVKMHGRWIKVRAHVTAIDGLSAHADQAEILRWLSGFRRPPRMTYVVHGEPNAADTLAGILRGSLGWKATVAEDRAEVDLVAGREES